jgi:hypothetical protein
MITAQQGPPERSAGGPPPWVDAAAPLPPFFSSFVFPGFQPGKTKLEKKGGIHIGFLAQGGAPLALGWYESDLWPEGGGYDKFPSTRKADDAGNDKRRNVEPLSDVPPGQAPGRGSEAPVCIQGLVHKSQSSRPSGPSPADKQGGTVQKSAMNYHISDKQRAS